MRKYFCMSVSAGSAEQPPIEVDIGQILPLLGREGFVEGLTPAIRFSH
jgi:hypothetical protein